MYRFNTQPPEGGCDPDMLESIALTVSTHSRPKAAGCYIEGYILTFRFQHTAARRRLLGLFFFASDNLQVSTHSRPKAAGMNYYQQRAIRIVSTHSRPKAAGIRFVCSSRTCYSFNTQPPEGG